MSKYGKPKLRQVLRTIDYDAVFLVVPKEKLVDSYERLQDLTTEELKTYYDYFVNEISSVKTGRCYRTIEIRLHPNKVAYEEVRLWMVKRAF